MPVIGELLAANKRFAESFDKADTPMPSATPGVGRPTTPSAP